MAAFMVQAGLGDPAGSRWITFDALVGAGASATAVPGSVLRGLGVAPVMRDCVRLGDGCRKVVDVGYTWLRFGGRRVMTYIAFNDECSSPLLGALTLGELWVGVDPVEGRLVPLRDMPL